MKILLFLLLSTCSLVADTQGVIDVIAKRHSGYSFDPLKDVTTEQIHSLIEAARWAPSAFNAQPWNFIFCSKKETPEAYQKASSCLAASNELWAENAPLLVVIVAGQKFKDKENRWGEYDTGAGAAQMALQAVALGLMTHQMGENCDEKKMAENFSIPEGYRVMSVMAVGVPLIPAPDPEKPRTRIPVKQNFFKGAWGQGF